MLPTMIALCSGVSPVFRSAADCAIRANTAKHACSADSLGFHKPWLNAPSSYAATLTDALRSMSSRTQSACPPARDSESPTRPLTVEGSKSNWLPFLRLNLNHRLGHGHCPTYRVALWPAGR